MNLNIEKLSDKLKSFPYIKFAYLFGSAKDGIILPGSDVDLALYYCNPDTVNFDKMAEILKVTDNLVPGIKCDICNLNNASETLRFEALKGTRLFVRDEYMEELEEFYSRTCREYEDYCCWTKTQLKYRGIRL